MKLQNINFHNQCERFSNITLLLSQNIALHGSKVLQVLSYLYIFMIVNQTLTCTASFSHRLTPKT